VTKYVTTKDIIVPKGSEVWVAGEGYKREYFVPFAEIAVEHTKDITSNWDMPLDEALELGLIKEV
jgi:hypothetical protein